MHMKDYTLTVRQVLENLATLAHSYETVSRGASPTGNYCFSINVADMAASLKAAQVLISQLPYWIPVEEQLPDDGVEVLVSVDENSDDCGYHVCLYRGDEWVRSESGYIFGVTHWMPLPEPPEVK